MIRQEEKVECVLRLMRLERRKGMRYIRRRKEWIENEKKEQKEGKKEAARKW